MNKLADQKKLARIQEKNWNKVNSGVCIECGHIHKNEFPIIEQKENHYVLQCESCKTMFWHGGNFSKIAYTI